MLKSIGWVAILTLGATAAYGLTKHQTEMNTMEDARAQVKQALEANAPDRAAVAAQKLERLLEPEVAYWNGLKQPEATEKAKNTVKLGRALAKGGSAAAMQKALDALTASCVECHASHPEYRLKDSER